MSALLVAILLHLVSPSVSIPPRLRVDVVFDGPPMTRRVDAVAMEEVSRIWAACGVDVRAADPAESARVGAVRLDVVLAERGSPHLAHEALGSIRFVNGVPEPRIALYLDVLSRFVSDASIDGHPYREWPLALRDATLGRALGRVLAHEIGHFLLASQNHRAKGLMRSEQILPDLVSPDWRRFALSAEDAALLQSFADAGRKESQDNVPQSREHS
jgi:hypothetical protein